MELFAYFSVFLLDEIMVLVVRETEIKQQFEGGRNRGPHLSGGILENHHTFVHQVFDRVQGKIGVTGFDYVAEF